jgi:hypothetical protein
MVALELARHPRRFWLDREVPKAGQKLFGSSLFFGPQAGVYLRDIDGATCQRMTSPRQLQQQSRAASFVVENVDNDAGIQKVDGHVSGP